jgi:hypothetical protein
MRFRRERSERLVACLHGVGNAEVILGHREAALVKAEIVTGTAHGWLDVMQRGGRMTVRTSDIVALWVEGGS